nr:immunoglobulin light chain junction region [Macaca mulatta]MOX25485.1 immunoglobulin light chain junction region [Macaca mulatta]MOX26411.1 immunoglobulin light chain junction region [Macaca mulatta]MOX26587.1 immunoglobulin light chain junction region [Macaca mulatta]
CLQGYSIPLTF